MPWREMLPMDQRIQFVGEFLSGFFTMTELTAHYGVSRKTGYKWVERYEAHGVAGLTDRSRRPHESPRATEPTLVQALVRVRKRHPRWGAKKLLGVVRREAPTAAWPTRSTVCDLLSRAGLVPPRRRRARPPVPLPTALAPIVRANGTWTTDFKGAFRTGDGIYCYPLTLRDGWSRYVLRCDALAGQTYEATRRRFARAFAQYGLPERIRSDNGGPFAGPGLGRLSRLSVWWMRLGIVPERIALGRPDQNGAHEQFHSVLSADTARPPAPNGGAQQRRFDRFRLEYNYERPHEALHDQPPATCYTASTRLLPATLPPIEYAGHMEVRRVSTVGCVSWRNRAVFLSEGLVGESVGFEEVDDGVWTVSFASIVLARFDERRGHIQRIAAE
jgi:transposase InsO family protein